MAITCRMPVISLIAWEDRSTDFIFVRVPNEYGRYLRTDQCVSQVPCPYTHCGATVGEPCMHDGRYVAGTHAVRREAGKNARRGQQFDVQRTDVIDQVDGATVTIK